MTTAEPQTIFVTGGSGFIGRNILRALGDQGRRVKALAAAPNGPFDGAKRHNIGTVIATLGGKLREENWAIFSRN